MTSTTFSFDRLNPFWALSRTPHGIIDMAAPALAALLCLGHFPSFSITLIGLITAFAGYTAVYALNDLVDCRTDQIKVRLGGYEDGEQYLDGVLMRHPLAKGVLSIPQALIWTVGWSALALMGAYWLNPVCVYIFLGGCLLEAAYCLLWRTTPLRALINGIVKSLGSIAAVYAVNPAPAPLFVAVLFGWIFFWEIGGQNIPNDWTDIDEDRSVNAKTIPVKFGPRRAVMLSVACLVLAFFLTPLLLMASALHVELFSLLAGAGLGAWLMLLPAWRLVEKADRQRAMALFNRASYFPLSLLILVLLRMAV